MEEWHWQITQHETFADYKQSIQAQKSIENEKLVNAGLFEGIGAKVGLGLSFFCGLSVLCYFQSPAFRQLINSMFVE